MGGTENFLDHLIATSAAVGDLHDVYTLDETLLPI